MIEAKEPNPKVEGLAFLAGAIGLAVAGVNLLGSLESGWPGGILVALAIVGVLVGLKKLGDASRAEKAAKRGGDGA